MKIELTFPENEKLVAHNLNDYQAFITQLTEESVGQDDEILKESSTHFFLIGKNNVITLLTEDETILPTWTPGVETTIESFLSEETSYGTFVKALKAEDFTMAINMNFDWLTSIIQSLVSKIGEIINHTDPLEKNGLTAEDESSVSAKLISIQTFIEKIQTKKGELLSIIPSKDQAQVLTSLQSIEGLLISFYSEYWTQISSWPTKTEEDEEGNVTTVTDLEEFYEKTDAIEKELDNFTNIIYEIDSTISFEENDFEDDEAVDEDELDDQTIVM